MRALYRLELSFSLSAVRPYVVDGASYLDRVVGDDVSSRELRRASAALSRKMLVRVDSATGSGFGAAAGFAAGVAGLFFDASSSVSDSSSELDSSSDDSDSSFFTTAGVAGVWFRNRLVNGFFSGSTVVGDVTVEAVGVTRDLIGAISAGFAASLELSDELSLLVRAGDGFVVVVAAAVDVLVGV